jgi:L-aspartate oxidase
MTGSAEPRAIRALPQARPRWSRDADVVVVGSGAAGMTSAITAAARGRRVLLVCKDELGGGSTPLAQGGMAAVLNWPGPPAAALDPDDSFGLHVSDTLTAGAGLCDPEAVTALVSSAPEVIEWLTSLGGRFGRGHLEGGHSRRRIVHAGGDAIGAEVHRVLAAALLASSVTVLTHAVALDLVDGGLLVGLEQAGEPELSVGTVRASAIVLATGGFGQAFATTTNPAGVTGDGLALAARAGAAVRDVEFVQFHPTVLWSDDASGQCPLVTEALRGAGAVIIDDGGDRVMAGRDLDPRDVVAAAMHARMTATGATHLWLDATMVGRDELENSFPTVTAACRKRGIDPAVEPIPVAPGAHYACGGVVADMAGRTSLPGVFAVGEVARTGVHGANRLASNSLTEAMAMGRRLGDLLGRELPEPSMPSMPSMIMGQTGQLLSSLTHDHESVAGMGTDDGVGVESAVRPVLAAAMSRYAGVLRDRAGLERLLRILAGAPESEVLDRATVEATNLHTVSTLVANAALAREESRGCHRRSDSGAPSGSDRPARPPR